MPGRTVRYGFAWSWINTTGNRISLTVDEFITTITYEEMTSLSSSSSPSLPSSPSIKLSISISELLQLVMVRIKKSCHSQSKNNINFVVDIPSILSTITSASMSGTALSDNIVLFEFEIKISIDHDIEIDVISTINNTNVKTMAISFYTNLKNDIIRRNRSWRRAFSKA